MHTNNLLLNPANYNSFQLNETTVKMNIGEVFSQRKNSYMNEFTLFIAHFNALPNCIEEEYMDCIKANQWFNEKYKSDIKDVYFIKRTMGSSKKAELDDIFYFMFDDLIVNFDINCAKLCFLYRKTAVSIVDELHKDFQKFKKRKKKQQPEISLLVNCINGIETQTVKITKPKLNIEENYNDDFKEVHHIIINRLSKKNDKGLILLHGKPGTGKTSYIRYLVASLKKDVIFLPPNMASAITNPNLISVLISNPNSIFVIEDAENIVVDREKDGSSPVSALLNISDGLLADCLNIQIICSFNTDISKIDNALMRKGRLIAKYEFKELEIEKAQKLSNKLGFKTSIEAPMTLTAIYNQEERDFHQRSIREAIGFKNRLATA
jgi:hypothetical protein